MKGPRRSGGPFMVCCTGVLKVLVMPACKWLRILSMSQCDSCGCHNGKSASTSTIMWEEAKVVIWSPIPGSTLLTWTNRANGEWRESKHKQLQGCALGSHSHHFHMLRCLALCSSFILNGLSKHAKVQKNFCNYQYESSQHSYCMQCISMRCGSACYYILCGFKVLLKTIIYF